MVGVWIYILKEEPTGFADRLDAARERNRGEDGSLIFGLSNERMEFPFSKNQGPGGGGGCEKGKIRNSLWNMSTLRFFLDMGVLTKQLDLQAC